jgi:hypothetical protein
LEVLLQGQGKELEKFQFPPFACNEAIMPYKPEYNGSPLFFNEKIRKKLTLTIGV